jgi:hypothetical protein
MNRVMKVLAFLRLGVQCERCAERTEAETLRESSLKDECRRLAQKLGKANALVNQHEATIATLNGIIQRELSGRHEEPEDAS